jgi:glucose-1-phosphatase
MIKHIIFDYGKVFANQPNDDVLFAFCKELGITPDEFVSNKKMIYFHLQHQKGLISTLDFYKRIVKELKKDVDPKKLVKLSYDIFYTKLKIDPEMINLLERLRKNYTVSCLSDVLPFNKDIYKKEKGYVFFHHLFLSCDIHMIKTDIKPFNYVLKKLGANPKETLFIDDSKFNIKVAKKTGIKTLLFENQSKLEAALKRLRIYF